MTRRGIAATAIVILGLLIAAALAPFVLGLLGAPVLAVTFAPLHAWLDHRVSTRAAAALVVTAAVLAIFVPVVGVTVMVISELPSVLSGPGIDGILAALTSIHVGRFNIGAEIASLGGDFAAWLSRQTMDIIGGATFVTINLLISFLGLYYLLVAGRSPWVRVAHYLPFSTRTAERLRVRFHEVTRATILGVGITAVLQGTVVGVSFLAVGLSHPLLWGTVTGIVSVLPILGSAMVWLPGVIVLFIDHRPGAAATLAAIGFVIASNIDNVVRPVIFRRASNIHPLVTVVGAFAGMRYCGLLGVLLGPLALIYFIELVRAFEHEYVPMAPSSHAAPSPATVVSS